MAENNITFNDRKVNKSIFIAAPIKSIFPRSETFLRWK